MLDPSTFERLVSCFEECRQPSALVRLVGLDAHPLVCDLMVSKQRNYRIYVLLQRLLYRADIEGSLFCTTFLKKKDEKAKKREGYVEKRSLAKYEPPLAWTYQGMKSLHFCDFFQVLAVEHRD